MFLGSVSLSMMTPMPRRRKLSGSRLVLTATYLPKFQLKFQLKPHPSPWFIPSCAAAIAHYNHYFHQYHRNVTPENKKLFCDSRNHCKRVLKDARPKYTETTRHSVASQLIGSCDFWRICNSVLNRGMSTIPDNIY